MKNNETKTIKNKSKSIKGNISNEVRSELPKMHSNFLKQFKGNHNFINKFIYVPDLISGGDSDVIKEFNRNTYEAGQYLSSGNIKYDLIGFSLDKSMHLKFQYLFQEKDSGLSSIAMLIETKDGWKVKKIEAFE